MATFRQNKGDDPSFLPIIDKKIEENEEDRLTLRRLYVCSIHCISHLIIAWGHLGASNFPLGSFIESLHSVLLVETFVVVSTDGKGEGARGEVLVETEENFLKGL